MTDDFNLEYVPDSFAGTFQEAEARTFEAWLRRNQSEKIVLDQAYLKHLSRFHGGMPQKRYFKTIKGTGHVVERFLNFLPYNSGHELAPYNVEGTWGAISDRLGKYLVPFAELFAGDQLCFDYSSEGRPKVVVWFHERSKEDHPYTELVADNFNEFVAMLRKGRSEL